MKLNCPIIVIDGITCSGKGIVLQHMAKKFHALGINGDPIMLKGVSVLQDRMKRIFGEYPGKEDPLKYLYRNLDCAENIDKRRALFNETRDYIEDQIYNTIKKSDNGLFIAEWQTSNLFNDLWQTAEYRIMIDSDINIRQERALERGRADDLAIDNISEIREKAFRPLLENAKNIDFAINNNSSIGSLIDSINAICSAIELR